MRRTPLFNAHVTDGARMVDFAGWQMPVQYGSILDEVRAVRSGVGVFDVSHMGQVRVSGAGALGAIQRLLTNDASKLAPGRAQYSLMCDDGGGILDDLIVYRRDGGAGAPDFLIVVNASNRETDFDWMSARGSGPDAVFDDVSDDYALIAVQGPMAEATLAPSLTGCDLAKLPAFSHAAAVFGSAPVHVARTGYTGEDGFEIFSAPTAAETIWRTLRDSGVVPCGLGARDVLRIEASYSLYGHEINRETNPYEAGLGWVVKPSKGDFIGREPIVAAKAAGLTRRLTGILPDDVRAIPRQGTVVTTAAGAGIVTSGTMSTTLDRAIGIAYLPKDAEGDVTLAMRGRELPARIVDLPFYKRCR
ncbi:MAG TPA: glycine cleavage system aminomethyltransferase GcvT [Armatimonadota bacterium]|jgi:aminomethyltransferase